MLPLQNISKSFGPFAALQDISLGDAPGAADAAGIPGATQKIPHKLFEMLPYAAALLARALLSRAKTSPTTLAQPWPKNH